MNFANVQKITIPQGNVLRLLSNGQVLWQVPAQSTETITGTLPLSFEAQAGKIISLIRYGKIAQNGTPTPESPVDIVCNNGAVRMVDDELPSGYKRLLDVTTNGSMRYVSNVHITGADTLRFTYKSSSGNLLGAYHDSDADDNYSYYPTTSSTAKYARYNGQTGGSSSATGTEYTIEMSPTGITGSRNPSSFTPSTFTASVPFCIFATSATGTPMSSATIYGSIEISGSQSVKFIPCERSSDGAIGYYETLNGEFLEAVGTGVPSTSGYDGSHLRLGVAGTPEVLSVAGQTASVANLYAVGDYKDEQDLISGVVTRKVGVKVFDGTEAFTISGTAFRTAELSDKAANTKVICSHFNGDVAPSAAVSSMPDLSVKGYGPNEAIFFKYSAITTVADFKAFLADQYAAGTPVIVLYPLAEEATESVTPQRLATVKGTNTVSTVANVSPVDGSCEYAFESSGSIVGTATVGTAVVE